MLMYFLIGLSLVLLGVVGLQFSYMFYVERVYRERKSYLRDLERKHARLAEELADAHRVIAEQGAMLEEVYPEREDEVWADVIEER